MHIAQATSSSNGNQSTNRKPMMGEEEDPADVDEPPDHIRFGRIALPSSHGSMSDGALPSPQYLKTRNASLLTQALLSSPDLTSGSEAEAPHLTSDGGLTSPSTPSPPLPDTNQMPAFGQPKAKNLPVPTMGVDVFPLQTSAPPMIDKAAQDTRMEADIKQRRCIKFACGGQGSSEPDSEAPEKTSKHSQGSDKPTEAPKRPCMLRFACPFKPPTQAVRGETATQSHPSTTSKATLAIPSPDSRHHRDSASTASTVKDGPRERTPSDERSTTSPATKRQKLGQTEATRFHAFGGSFGAEDEWTREEIKDKEKITVNDTLRKENAIRKLGEEAEEEAIEEDQEEDNEDEDAEMSDAGDDESFSDGNETDNEEGFADSDEESDVDSDYQFWTPGLTTAATSTDHIEHIRPTTRRKASDSSIDSIINISERRIGHENPATRSRRGSSARKAEKMRPGTPDLPDSTDFVCGTLDEDRPLEAAYMSCLEQRKQSRHRIIPQDIDPSFPTSDPEMDEEDEEDDDELDIARSDSGPDDWIAGRPDDTNSENEHSGRQKCPLRKGGKSPMPSPRRMRSPPPPIKRAAVHRSPPPRKLFGHSPPPKLAPLGVGQGLKSPLSTRMTSPAARQSKRRRTWLYLA